MKRTQAKDVHIAVSSIEIWVVLRFFGAEVWVAAQQSFETLTEHAMFFFVNLEIFNPFFVRER
jgi:hypothetical protein